MNQQQKKYLRDQLEMMERRHSSVIYATEQKVPAAVKRARELVQKWEKQARDASYARRNAMHAARKNVTEVILFGDEPTARAAIDAFSKQRF